jgi:hypothetical protein
MRSILNLLVSAILLIAFSSCGDSSWSSAGKLKLPGVPPFSVKQTETKVVVTGSWKSDAHPVSGFVMEFDKPSSSATLCFAAVADYGSLVAQLVTEIKHYEIESWNESAIVTKVSRCGRSETFVQYKVDLKERSITRSFTGQSPSAQTLK